MFEGKGIRELGVLDSTEGHRGVSQREALVLLFRQLGLEAESLRLDLLREKTRLSREKRVDLRGRGEKGWWRQKQ
jgi:hypothetical protein